MRKLEIYEPPLCCPTGVCGPAPDPALAALQENILQWKKEGIAVERLVAVKEELESPCTEEMAVFEEFSRMVERDDFEYVVFDTAPTGHTLRLLELPYDYARQVEMMVSIPRRNR